MLEEGHHCIDLCEVEVVSNKKGEFMLRFKTRGRVLVLFVSTHNMIDLVKIASYGKSHLLIASISLYFKCCRFTAECESFKI